MAEITFNIEVELVTKEKKLVKISATNCTHKSVKHEVVQYNIYDIHTNKKYSLSEISEYSLSIIEKEINNRINTLKEMSNVI